MAPRVLVFLFHGEAHRHPHEENLRQFDARAVAVNEVAVVQGLQPEVGELQVALRQQRIAELLEVVLFQLGRYQLQFHALLDVGGERLRVQRRHVVLGCAFRHTEEAQCLGAQVVAEQARGDVGVVRLLFDHGARGDDEGGAQLVGGHAVVEVLQRLVENFRLADVGEIGAGLADDGVQAAQVQGLRRAVGLYHVDAVGGGLRRLGQVLLGGALAGALLAVDHVVAGDLVLAGAHQGQFHLVLDVLDVDRAARGHAALEGGAHLLGEPGDRLVDTAGRSRGAALDSEEGLGDGHGDLAVLEGDDRPVALDDPQLPRCRGGDIAADSRSGGGGGGAFGGGTVLVDLCLHVFSEYAGALALLFWGCCRVKPLDRSAPSPREKAPLWC